MKIILSMIISLVSIMGVRAGDGAADSNSITTPPDFTSLPYKSADAAVREDVHLILSAKVKQIRPEYLTNLVHQLRFGELADDNKVLAIYLLGALRPGDTNSIQALIELIDFEATRFDPSLAPRRWGKYPAQGALVKIGRPVIDPVLENLAAETQNLRRQLMCKTLVKIEEKAVAVERVQRGLDNEPDPLRRANLKLARQVLEDLHK